MVQQIKIDRVEELTSLLREAKSAVLNDFTGLNVADISALRRKCREKGISYIVVKNTLARLSFHELGVDDIDSLLAGPTAIAVSNEDEVLPAQVLKEFAADYELPRVKGAYVSGRVVDEAAVKLLAGLPGRDVLVAQVVGTMQAPLRNLVGVLGATIRDFVGVCRAVAEKKGEAA